MGPIPIPSHLIPGGNSRVIISFSYPCFCFGTGGVHYCLYRTSADMSIPSPVGIPVPLSPSRTLVFVSVLQECITACTAPLLICRSIHSTWYRLWRVESIQLQRGVRDGADRVDGLHEQRARKYLLLIARIGYVSALY